MLTPEQLKDAGIFPDADAQDCMWVESGLEWLKAYTTLPIGTIDGDTIRTSSRCKTILAAISRYCSGWKRHIRKH